jgi:NAD(P)-dependent dehydrogenase (short-subunit alcohol dehydrogenase family)
MKIKKTFILLGSEGLIGKSFKNLLISKNLQLLCIDIKKLKNQKKKNFLYLKKNINDPKSVIEIIKFAEKKFGKFNYVIDCSYPKLDLNRSKNLKNYEYKKLQSNISENISKNIMISEIFGDYFVKKKIKGNMIFLNSIQGVMAPKFNHYIGTKMISPAEYTAIKFSLSGLIKYFAKFYGKFGINFNCISPGGILNNQPKKFLKKYKESCLTKGMLSPDDLNSTLELLINEKSKLINGQNILVDDGWTL